MQRNFPPFCAPPPFNVSEINEVPTFSRDFFSQKVPHMLSWGGGSRPQMENSTLLKASLTSLLFEILLNTEPKLLHMMSLFLSHISCLLTSQCIQILTLFIFT